MDDIAKQKERVSLFFRYAMHYGLLLGIVMVLVFLLFAYTVNNNNLLYQMVCILLAIAVPFVAYFFTKKYRDNVLEEAISFSQAWNFGSVMFFFSALILAIVMYITIQYFEPNLVSNVIKNGNASLEEYIKQVPANEANQQQFTLLRQQFDQLSKMPIPSAIDFAIGNLWSCFSSGIILSVIIALFVKKKPKSDIYRQTFNS